MHLSTEVMAGVRIARLAGELDKLAAEDARDALEPLLSPEGLVVDLGGLTFIDSAGLHLLFELVRSAPGGDVAVAVSVPESSPIRRVVDLVRLGSVAPVLSSVEEAAAALRVSS